MTVAELAASDQAEAKEREFERRAARYARYILGAFLILAGYGVLASGGWVPAAPWSPIGQQQQAPVESPERYQPVAPVAPATEADV